MKMQVRQVLRPSRLALGPRPISALQHVKRFILPSLNGPKQRSTWRPIRLNVDTKRHLNTGGLTNLFEPVPGALQIRNISENNGIELEDGLTLKSSCILIGGKVFLWKTPGKPWNGWTEKDFEIFDVVVPKPEILLFGTGKSLLLPPPSIRQYLHKIGVQVDFMDTKNAGSTFNLLTEEGRRVAAALLPLSDSSWA